VSSEFTTTPSSPIEQATDRKLPRPQREHTEIEEELHERAHIDYDRVAIVSAPLSWFVLRHIPNIGYQIANPAAAALYEDALVYETGSAITSSGALSAYSGAKTGRSPSDKRIVQESSSEKEVWWGPVNKPMTQDVGQNHIPSILAPAIQRLVPASIR
jgi:phosphoenolpyruvate carboxykinase (ATP)